MIYTRPYVTSTFVAFGGDSKSRGLSMAVRLIDDFTRRQPEMNLRVRLRPVLAAVPPPRPVRGASGAYCFEDVPNGNYTLTVETEGTRPLIYLMPPLPITIPLPALPDPTIPLVEIVLTPSSAYPYPPDATLVRGVVTQLGTGDPVPDALVNATYDQVDPADELLTVLANVETRADIDGQFALFFRRLPAHTQNVTITAAQGGNQVQAPVMITEGATQTVNLPALP